VLLAAQFLQGNCNRPFTEAFTAARAATMRCDDLLTKRLDAYAARFARLQDTAGDKLLPALLTCLGAPVYSVLG
jgi:hypothetical protein